MFWTNFNKKPTTSEVGELTENLAKLYLEQNGLVFKDANFSSKAGEIDLIMQDKNTLVFIEVKYRKSTNFGGAILAVSPSKQSKIKKCAQYYLQQHSINEYNASCRFDVVTLEGLITNPVIDWLKDAF